MTRRRIKKITRRCEIRRHVGEYYKYYTHSHHSEIRPVRIRPLVPWEAADAQVQDGQQRGDAHEGHLYAEGEVEGGEQHQVEVEHRLRAEEN